MEFVDFNLAKKLKEKGFKEKCVAYYWEKINEHTPSFVVEDNMPEDGIILLDLLSNHNQAEWSHFIDAPIISQVFKWLREDNNIHISIGYSGETKWRYVIIYLNEAYFDNLNIIKNRFDSYEQAALAGIKYVLDNLI